MSEDEFGAVPRNSCCKSVERFQYSATVYSIRRENPSKQFRQGSGREQNIAEFTGRPIRDNIIIGLLKLGKSVSRLIGDGFITGVFKCPRRLTMCELVIEQFSVIRFRIESPEILYVIHIEDRGGRLQSLSVVGMSRIGDEKSLVAQEAYKGGIVVIVNFFENVLTAVTIENNIINIPLGLNGR